jgi:hypothetical protein
MRLVTKPVRALICRRALVPLEFPTVRLRSTRNALAAAHGALQIFSPSLASCHAVNMRRPIAASTRSNFKLTHYPSYFLIFVRRDVGLVSG